jgi:hypothetical protein
MNARGSWVSVSAAVALFLPGCASWFHETSPKVHASAANEIYGARALDQQGVLAFEAGRYHDALLFFDAAYAHGGPPSERWNSAKCHLRLDEPFQAESLLTEYLSLAGLSKEDRREATSTLDELRRRPSTLMVLSAPLGLPVVVDGRRVGVTPVTTWVAPGDHSLLVDRPPDVHMERPFTARFGRAVLVEAHP